MQTPTCALVMFLMTGSACAVLYTKTSDTDYPKLDKKSFFTATNGNHYPRIGRRSATGSQYLIPGSVFRDILDKRGIYTQGSHGSYPRVGRRSDQAFLGEDYENVRSKLLQRLSGVKDDDRIVGSGIQGVPLEVMFVDFDSDSDGKLSKDEFISGASQYQQRARVY